MFTGQLTPYTTITALLEPALAIIGHEHKIYYAYPSSTTGDITILGPDEKFTNSSTRSVQGIFKLISFYATILDYGYQVEKENGREVDGGLWGDYWRKLLKKLAEASIDEVTKEIGSWFSTLDGLFNLLIVYVANPPYRTPAARNAPKHLSVLPAMKHQHRKP